MVQALKLQTPVQALTLRIPRGAMRTPPVAAPRLLTVNLGDIFYADVYASNNTGSDVTKDILVAYGEYDPGTGQFTMYWGYVADNVTIPVGDNVMVASIECVAELLGTWDVLAATGTYDPGTGTFTIETAIVKEDELTVTGVTVTDVQLHT